MATVSSSPVRNKIADLLQFFDSVDLSDGKPIKLDTATTIIDVEKFVNFSKVLLRDVDEVTSIKKPYIIRLHRLRQYYEQKRKDVKK